MTRHQILFWLFFLNINFSFAQDSTNSYSSRAPLYTDIENKIDSLKNTGVEYLITYSSYNSGMPMFVDSAGLYDIEYLLWTQNSITYTQKFVDKNNLSFKRPKPQVIKDNMAFKFLKENYKAIRSEDILPFIVKSSNDSIEYYTPLGLLHETHLVFTIYNLIENFDKDISQSYLTESLGDMNNLNYKYNQHTKLKSFIDLVKDLTGALYP